MLRTLWVPARTWREWAKSKLQKNIWHQPGAYGRSCRTCYGSEGEDGPKPFKNRTDVVFTLKTGFLKPTKVNYKLKVNDKGKIPIGYIPSTATIVGAYRIVQLCAEFGIVQLCVESDSSARIKPLTGW